MKSRAETILSGNSGRVFYNQTLSALQKLISRQVISSLQEVLSTGKEAEVFLAVGADGPVAVKVFKTMLTKFRRRSDYI